MKEFLITLNPDYEKTKIETMKKQIRKSARNKTLYCGYKINKNKSKNN